MYAVSYRYLWSDSFAFLLWNCCSFCFSFSLLYWFLCPFGKMGLFDCHKGSLIADLYRCCTYTLTYLFHECEHWSIFAVGSTFYFDILSRVVITFSKLRIDEWENYCLFLSQLISILEQSCLSILQRMLRDMFTF